MKNVKEKVKKRKKETENDKNWQTILIHVKRERK